MPRRPYPSDLSDAEWAKLKPLLPVERNRIGSPREVKLREIMNALLYVADNGIKWRAMPHDLPAIANRVWLFSPLERSSEYGNK